METPEGKVSLLDTIPVRCDHILTEWEGDYAVISVSYTHLTLPTIA